MLTQISSWPLSAEGARTTFSAANTARPPSSGEVHQVQPRGGPRIAAAEVRLAHQARQVPEHELRLAVLVPAPQVDVVRRVGVQPHGPLAGSHAQPQRHGLRQGAEHHHVLELADAPQHAVGWIVEHARGQGERGRRCGCRRRSAIHPAKQGDTRFGPSSCHPGGRLSTMVMLTDGAR